MSRIGIANMAWGFCLIFIAACGGAFVALSLTEVFISRDFTPDWQRVLQATSHGHTALFGVIHVMLGLTMPYDGQNDRIRKLKTAALFCGSFAMGPLMLTRAALGPTESSSWSGLVVGGALAIALFAILSHSVDLFRKLANRG